jgi:hypothetical protein
VALAQALRAHQHGGSLITSSGGASARPTGDRSGGVVVRGVPGQEAMTHLISGEGGVSGGMTPRAGAR